MATISAKRVESSEGDFSRRQIVRVPTGLYGAMFAWCSLPKLRQKYQSQEEEEVFFVGAVLTHDRANQQLPHFSEAIASIRPKIFFDEKTGMKSSYVALLYALFGGKKSYEEIVDADEDFDLDEFIGRPFMAFVDQNQKADKNGLFGHRMKSVEPADKGLIAAIKPLYQSRKVEKVGEHGLARLHYPAPAYEEDVAVTSGGYVSGNGDNAFEDDLDDEIPF